MRPRAFAAAVLFVSVTFVSSRAAGQGLADGKVLRHASGRNDPIERWEFDYESAVLWSVGARATPLPYIVLPQLLTLKTPAVSRRPFRGGELVLRSRFSLLIEPIVKGPETHYIGASASGSLEWWNIPRTRVLFFSSGGGLGGMNSKGYEIAGAQGQDLNFNWFLYAGGRIRIKETMNLGLGIYFQHLSNRNLDRINPGLDALGPIASVGWHF